jgi:Domain of unknown function (DUF4136)
MQRLLFLTLLLTAIVSCGPSIRVFSDYDKDIKVEDYKTFTWLDAKAIEAKGTNPLYYNELNDKRIKTAINAAMAAKGYRLLKDNGELELHYHIVVEDKTTFDTEPYGYIYSPYWVGRRVNVFQYREGTLIVDVMEKKTNTLVWRGWATDVITKDMTKNPEKAIADAVQAIYKKYPFSGL